MSGSITSSTAATEVLVDGFVGYLRSERGVTALTVEAYVSDVRRFLARRGDGDVSGLTPAEVSNAVLAQVGERSPATVRRFASALRSFLRYCAIWSAWLIRICQRRCCRCQDGAVRCFRRASASGRAGC